MSLDQLNFSSTKNRRKKGGLLLLLILSSIAISASFAGLLVDQGKTDSEGIVVMVDGQNNNLFTKVASDHSGRIQDRNATVVNVTQFTSSVSELTVGNSIGDPTDTLQSDGRYYSVITEDNERSNIDYSGEASLSVSSLADHSGVIDNNSIRLTVFQDNDGFRTIDVANIGETKEVYQTYKVLGSSYKYFGLRSLGLSFDEFSNLFNFHGDGGYPSYFTEINFTIRFRFADLANPTSATPLSYTIKFFNYLTNEFDAFRIVNTSLINTYAQGIYQDDILNLNLGNANFPAYFDPTDRITMLMRIGLEFTYRAGTNGILQQIDLDQIEYTWSARSQMAELKVNNPSLDPAIWRKDPRVILESKSNSSVALPDDVIQMTYTFLGFHRFGITNIPTGFFDEGIEPTVNTFTAFGSIRIFSKNPVKVDFDSIIHIIYPEQPLAVSNRWFVNESTIDDVLWEINITTDTNLVDPLLNLPSDFEILQINTPFGDDATKAFSFTNDLLLSEQVINAFGYGTYQVIAKSPNYITFASISDGNFDPISITSYSSPINHFAEIRNFNNLLSASKIGIMNVSFITENGEFQFFNTTVTEAPDGIRDIFKGQTTFPGSSVGVVDNVWTWTNGEEFGIYFNQFVMLGTTSDAPFVKIFNPVTDQRIKDNTLLYIAVVALTPEKIGFALDASLIFTKMTAGFYDGFSGVSSLLQGFTYYANIPTQVFEHDTNHFIKVEATEGSNDKKTQETTSFRIDNQILVSIDEIEESYDDVPTTVRYTVDNDAVLVNVYLDNNLIGSLTGNAITGEFKIPRLTSGTYFIDLTVRDDIGNMDTTAGSFFTNQRNPTILGTILQVISDFFKILSILLLSFFSIGIVSYTRRKKRSRKCPFGKIGKDGVCGVGID